MGCFSSKDKTNDDAYAAEGSVGRPNSTHTPPKWTSDKPLTRADLNKMREEFWDTSPHYGGDRVIWDALKGAAESDASTSKLILDSAGIVIGPPDLTVCYDERGAKYELPKFVWSDPINGLISEPGPHYQGS